MLATDLVVGRAYAQRAKPNDAERALRKIIFVGPAKAGKAKIRHADSDLDGLEEWVLARTLMCPWGKRQAFLRDESRWNALQEAAARDYDPVIDEAISTVFAATGDEIPQADRLVAAGGGRMRGERGRAGGGGDGGPGPAVPRPAGLSQ